MAFDRLDKDGSGVVTIEDVRSAYDTSKHPDVISGKKTSDEALGEFMAQWDTGVRDGRITKDEFLDYYKGAVHACAVFCRHVRRSLPLTVCRYPSWSPQMSLPQSTRTTTSS
jgi:predicted transcriptional regulator